MDDLAENRVDADHTGAIELVVAAMPGIVIIAVSQGRVGEFGVVRRCSPTDVAVRPASDGGPVPLAVSTDEDVLLAPAGAVEALEPTGFGPATAVTFDGPRLVAGSPAGELGAHDGTGWEPLGALPAAPTALEGDLVGTAAGIFRVADSQLRPAGLQDVNDLARVAGTPLAATDAGLYELGNGWLEKRSGAFQVVAGAADGRAHAATSERFYERTDGGWRVIDSGSGAPIDAVAYADRTYALDAAGDLLVDGPSGWANQPLGLDAAVALDVLDADSTTSRT